MESFRDSAIDSDIDQFHRFSRAGVIARLDVEVLLATYLPDSKTPSQTLRRMFVLVDVFKNFHEAISFLHHVQPSS